MFLKETVIAHIVAEERNRLEKKPKDTQEAFGRWLTNNPTGTLADWERVHFNALKESAKNLREHFGSIPLYEAILSDTGNQFLETRYRNSSSGEGYSGH